MTTLKEERTILSVIIKIIKVRGVSTNSNYCLSPWKPTRNLISVSIKFIQPVLIKLLVLLSFWEDHRGTKAENMLINIVSLCQSTNWLSLHTKIRYIGD